MKLNNYPRSIWERLSIWVEGWSWTLREFMYEFFSFPGREGVSCEKGLDEVCSCSILKPTLEEACQLVERQARSIGKSCEIIFTPDGVQVAPLSWPGESFGDTLYEALIGAAK